MKEIQIIPPNQDRVDEEQSGFTQKGYLALPFEADQFREFIVSLLGKQQSFEKRYYGDFEIELKDIQHIHELLNQRISQQNNGKLVQFTGTLFFSDNSNVTLRSYGEFITYNELKQVSCVAVSITWIYLIQFPDKNVPEKQEINLRILASHNPLEIPELGLKRFMDVGRFETNIFYTARTWGYDIESLLAGEIGNLVKKENKIRNYISKKGGWISVIAGILLWTISLIYMFYSAQKFIGVEKNKINSFIEQNHSLDEKLDYLVTFVASGTTHRYFFNLGTFIFINLVASLFAAIWINSRIENLSHKRSFILLTKYSYKDKERSRNSEKREWIWLLASLIISLTLDILGNYFYDIMSK